MGAYNGSGTFVRTYDWTTDEGNGINIEASRMDTEDDGFATGLSTAITKDGQTTITANIPFNSKKITGLTVGSARTDSISLGQVQDGTYTTLGTAGGSADTYTATPSPAITAYATGSRYILKIQADNTGASTLNISAVGAKNIKKYDGAGAKVDVEAGDLQQDQYYDIFYDGTDIVVLNPQLPYTTLTNATAASATQKGVVELLTDAELATGTDTTRAATAANILSLFATSSQATNGYARIPVNISGGFDEIIIQWGTASIAVNTNANVTLPLTFPNSTLSVQATYNSTSAGLLDVGAASITSASQIAIANGSDTNTSIFWLAIGY